MVWWKRSFGKRDRDRINLEKTISNIQTILLGDIPYLNYGGCVHFAYFLSKELTSLDIGHTIYLWSRDSKESTEVTSYLEFKAVSHVIVYIAGIGYVDGHHTYRKRRSREYKFGNPTNLNLKEIRKSKYNWNSDYDISNNDYVKKVIKTEFNGYRRERLQNDSN